MGGVTITELIDKMGLRNMTPELETDNVMLVHADVNRPALQLTGFFDHFDKDRVQIIGYVENAYISTLTPQRRREMFDKLLSSGIPCLVYSRGMAPEEEVLELCNHYGVPCMVSEKTTSDLMAEIIRWLNVKMAPMISIHGVLVDVFGEGVLIMGESGIGIIDVKTLFGVESVKDTQSIDMVIKLEEWDKDKEYDRLGMEDQYTEFLGNKIVCHSIPIRPGRNLAIIVESAAVNYRTKKMGYNAAKELYKRVQANLARRD